MDEGCDGIGRWDERGVDGARDVGWGALVLARVLGVRNVPAWSIAQSSKLDRRTEAVEGARPALAPRLQLRLHRSRGEQRGVQSRFEGVERLQAAASAAERR